MITAAVIVGAGSGSRFGGDKVFADLAGRPVIAHTAAAFQESPLVDRIVLVLRQDAIEVGKALVASQGLSKVSAICAGGARRQDSVAAGVSAADADVVLIHDAARPLVDAGVIQRGLAALGTSDAAIAALPIRDTVKRVDDDGRIIETVDRSMLWSAQTPQVFRSPIINQALLVAGEWTDDAAAVERLGFPVTVFPGSERNFKITTTADLRLAEAILRCG